MLHYTSYLSNSYFDTTHSKCFNIQVTYLILTLIQHNLCTSDEEDTALDQVHTTHLPMDISEVDLCAVLITLGLPVYYPSTCLLQLCVSLLE